jgi:orotate phosphoribosyltransferase
MGTELDAFDQLFTVGVNKAILWALALSGLFIVLEVLGFLPKWLSNWINRNRLRETMRLLKEFGIDAGTSKRANSVAHLEQISGRSLAERVTRRLETMTIKHPVVVGTQLPVQSNSYIDLMGATSDIEVARLYARDLSALWRSLAGVGGQIANTGIDFIVVPKAGSPLLASCFAELIEKPLLIHNSDRKFASEKDDPRAIFDCKEVPPPGSRGLIVDDSSTGGGKALKLIEDLRHYKWEVSDFIVVFEPQLKVGTGDNAAERLKPRGVMLHSIVKT